MRMSHPTGQGRRQPAARQPLLATRGRDRACFHNARADPSPVRQPRGQPPRPADPSAGDGPTFERGDERGPGDKLSPASEVQRGRALSSAEILPPRGHQVRGEGLQRGRALSSAEIGRLARTTPGRLVASTGPRSFERGDVTGTATFNAPITGFNGAALFRARRSSWHYRSSHR